MEVPGSAPPTLSFPLERKKKGLPATSVDHISRGEGGEVERKMGILWHSKD